MLWNPGLVNAQMLADLPPDDWQYFVCIEPVCVSKPKVLAQGEVFEGTLLAKWVDNRKTG